METASAPKTSTRFWIIIALCGLPLLYILSFGPVLRFCSTKNPFSNSRSQPRWVPIVYKPLFHAAFGRPGSPYSRYITWWLKLANDEE